MPRFFLHRIAVLAVAATLTGSAAAAQDPQTIDLLSQANVRIDGAAAGDGLSEVVGVGDVNGDGRADLAVGAADADTGGASSGAVYVVFGRPTPVVVDLAGLGAGGFRIDGEAGTRVGSRLAAVGDTNGDGLGDLAIGTPFAGFNGRASSGSTYVVFGRSSPTNISLASLGTGGYRIDGAAASDGAGDPAAVGDYNGDGRADVAIGASGAGNNGRSGSGSVYVVFGKTTTSNVDLAAFAGAAVRIDGAAAGDLLGRAIAEVGDMNGDGKRDLAIGAQASNAAPGSVYVVFRPAAAANLDLLALGAGGFRIAGVAAGDLTGSAVADLGDLTGDGRSEIGIGAPGADNNGRIDSGSAYVLFGRASTTDVNLADLIVFPGGLPLVRGFRIDGAAADDGLGSDVVGPGDVNGDGRPDVVVDAQNADNSGRPSSGSTYVVTAGRPTAFLATQWDMANYAAAGVRIDGAASGDFSGWSVGAVGDVTADGRPDIAITALFADNNGRTTSGSVWIVGFGVPALTYPSIVATVGVPAPTASPSALRTTGPGTFAASGLPGGLAIDAGTGAIGGTPLSSGTASATVSVTDVGGVAQATVPVTIRRCVTLRSGTNRRNTIRGDGSSDNIVGRGGNDRLFGGANEDCLSGGSGSDQLSGGAAFDTLSGGVGNDTLRGDSGPDSLSGGPADDTLLGGSGADVLKGGLGRDTLIAGAGNDTVLARDGRRDTINCGPGADTATVDRVDRTRGCETVKRS